MVYEWALLKNNINRNKDFLKNIEETLFDSRDMDAVDEFKKNCVLYKKERGREDGLLYGLPLEMKQRQDAECEALWFHLSKFKDFTIQASSVKFENEIFIIYDLNYNCFVAFTYKDVDFNSLEERWQITKSGKRYKVKYYHIPFKNIKVFNSLSYCEVKDFMLWAKQKKEEYTNEKKA